MPALKLSSDRDKKVPDHWEDELEDETAQKASELSQMHTEEQVVPKYVVRILNAQDKPETSKVITSMIESSLDAIIAAYRKTRKSELDIPWDLDLEGGRMVINIPNTLENYADFSSVRLLLALAHNLGVEYRLVPDTGKLNEPEEAKIFFSSLGGSLFRQKKEEKVVIRTGNVNQQAHACANVAFLRASLGKNQGILRSYLPEGYLQGKKQIDLLTAWLMRITSEGSKTIGEAFSSTMKVLINKFVESRWQAAIGEYMIPLTELMTRVHHKKQETRTVNRKQQTVTILAKPKKPSERIELLTPSERKWFKQEFDPAFTEYAQLCEKYRLGASHFNVTQVQNELKVAIEHMWKNVNEASAVLRSRSRILRNDQKIQLSKKKEVTYNEQFIKDQIYAHSDSEATYISLSTVPIMERLAKINESNPEYKSFLDDKAFIRGSNKDAKVSEATREFMLLFPRRFIPAAAKEKKPRSLDPRLQQPNRYDALSVSSDESDVPHE